MKTSNNPPSPFTDAPKAGDFQSAVDLLAVLGEANRRLTALTAEIEAGYLEIVSTKRETYAALQQTVSDNEAALEAIARRNPQWFVEKKTVTTPFGAVKFHSSTEIVVADENVSIQLIASLGKGKQLLRSVQVLNKEALEKLSDEQLAKFALVRKPKQNFSVNTVVVELGKAVKAAEKSAKKTNQTAKKASALVSGAATVILFLLLMLGAPALQAAESPVISATDLIAQQIGTVRHAHLAGVQDSTEVSFAMLRGVGATAESLTALALLLERAASQANQLSSTLRAFGAEDYFLGMEYGYLLSAKKIRGNLPSPVARASEPTAGELLGNVTR